MKTKTKRSGSVKKPRYSPVLKLPALPPDQYEALRNNIAVNGVLVPILVDSDGTKRRIIDGNYRKNIAVELGYDCPEIVHQGEEEELRILARSLNLARRQLSTDQKRELIADQLKETPDRTSRWIAKMLGVSHVTVASVRAELESVGHLVQQDRRVGTDGKLYRPTHKPVKVVERSVTERRARIESVTLIHGDCTRELKKIASKSIDAIICDPPYPEVNRPYGRISEKGWHSMMQTVIHECRRVLKPKGSAVFILQPNFQQFGKMRLWLYDFVAWAGREMGLVQDAYWWSINCLPTGATSRNVGLLRQSVKWCVWLGPSNCYRNQDGVLWEQSDAMSAVKWSDRCLRNLPSGQTVRPGRVAAAADERGGVTPFNLLPIASTHPVDHCGHPASTPYDLASWWCKYLLPENGTLLDPFCGSGTSLVAGLDHGASRVIGIEKERKYIQIAKRRIANG